MCKEHIPDTDNVSRLVTSPPMTIDEQNYHIVNLFESLSKGESVVWRRYAIAPHDVHACGASWQVGRAAAGKPGKYLGFVTAVVEKIRSFRSKRGHSFFVEHEPDGGLHHAHVGYLPADGAPLKPADKGELKLALSERIFGLLTAVE